MYMWNLELVSPLPIYCPGMQQGLTVIQVLGSAWT